MAKRAKRAQRKRPAKTAPKRARKPAAKKKSAAPKRVKAPAKAKKKATPKPPAKRKPAKKPAAAKAKPAPKAKPRAKARPAPRARAAKRVAPAPAAPPIAVDVAEQEALRAKFELGPHAWTQVLDAREKAQTIPWGYGRDRVTAMAVDPEQLFVYWEVTDESLARARDSLGGEAGALVLRVHDVTGLLFDGSNAHHWHDVEIGRSDRRWFHHVGRPGSSVVVELGVRGGDGRFAAIARSKRVDFPRRGPGHDGPIEWMTVREAKDDGARPRLELAPAPSPFGEAPARGDAANGPDGGGDDEWRRARAELWFAGAGLDEAPSSHVSTWRLDEAGFAEWFAESFGDAAFEFDGERYEWLGPATPLSEATQLRELGAGEWIRESADGAGARVVQRDAGVVVQSIGGVTRVRRGPWQLEIRGAGPGGARRLLARWELRRSWVTSFSRERFGERRFMTRAVAGAVAHAPIGASEQQAGASERLLLGASERMRAAGSELRLAGASEQRLAGGSERRLRGRGESAFGGSSEKRLGGSESARRA